MSNINLSRDSIETIIDAVEIALRHIIFSSVKSRATPKGTTRAELSAVLEMMLTMREYDAEFKPSQVIINDHQLRRIQ